MLGKRIRPLLFIPLIACAVGVPDLFDAPSASSSPGPFAVGETVAVALSTSGGRSFTVQRSSCDNCTAVLLGSSGTAAAFEVTGLSEGTSTLLTTVRTGSGHSYDLSHAVAFARATQLRGARSFDSAPAGAALPLLEGDVETWCFAPASSEGYVLQHDSAKIEMVAGGTIDLVERVPNTALLLDTTLTCARLSARERGPGELTVRFRDIERKIAIDVIDASDIASLDFIDATSVANRAEVLDVTDDIVTPRSALADVRASRCGTELLIRGSTAGGRSAVLRVDPSNVTIDPPTLATAYTSRPDGSSPPLLALAGRTSGEGTLRVTVGATTRTVPLHLGCER